MFSGHAKFACGYRSLWSICFLRLDLCCLFGICLLLHAGEFDLSLLERSLLTDLRKLLVDRSNHWIPCSRDHCGRSTRLLTQLNLSSRLRPRWRSLKTTSKPPKQTKTARNSSRLFGAREDHKWKCSPTSNARNRLLMSCHDHSVYKSYPRSVLSTLCILQEFYLRHKMLPLLQTENRCFVSTKCSPQTLVD